MLLRTRIGFLWFRSRRNSHNKIPTVEQSNTQVRSALQTGTAKRKTQLSGKRNVLMFAVSSVFKENSEALCSVHGEMARQRYTCPKNIESVGITLSTAASRYVSVSNRPDSL